MKTSLLDRALRFLGRSQFFTYSALLHLLLVGILGTQVYISTQKDNTLPTAVMPQSQDPERGDRSASHLPPPSKPVEINDGRTIKSTSDPTTNGKTLRVASTPPIKLIDIKSDVVVGCFPGPSLNKVPNLPDANPLVSPFSQNAKPTTEQLKNLRQFNDHQVSGQKGSLNGKYEFTLYVAKYGSTSDWQSAHRVVGGQIVGGAMPNLTYVMRNWTKEKVDAQVSTKPLDLAGNDLFEVRPPFIYFSGTKDFTLREMEVENLRKYITLGGAIWGDSSLPGRNSRFDIAFRREMLRVVGDKSMDFKALSLDHPIFGGMKYDLAEVPAGLNFYAEPIYAIRMFGELSIIYTPNDYGDMMTVALGAAGKIDTRRDVNNRFVAIDERLWENRGTYYRNVNEASLEKTYQFSTNLVYYLLTRWQVRQEF